MKIQEYSIKFMPKNKVSEVVKLDKMCFTNRQISRAKVTIEIF